MMSSEQSDGPRGSAEFRLFRKILLAVDVSERTPSLIMVGAYLANTFGAEMTVATVVKMVTSVRGDETDGSPATAEEEKLKETLTELVKQNAGERSESVQVKILHGEPAQRICEYAEFLSVDLIVIGSRGYGALKRAILGSTSAAVAANSKTSVIILK